MSVRAKEAIKAAVAMVLVYWIALSLGWMNPYWAGWAVAMVSLSTAGESLRKGVLRVAGTVPACIAALLILSVAPQSRWTFIALVCAWIFAMSYMMNTDTKRGYFWQVAGFVLPIVILAGPASSEVAFEHAVFRTVETAMGVTVYMLITVFLWPRTNAGSLQKASQELMASQEQLFEEVQRPPSNENTDEGLEERYRAQAQKLAAVEHALESEGSERYSIFRQRARWRQFIELSKAQLRVLARLQTGRIASGAVDLSKALPGLDEYLEEQRQRFQSIQGLLGSGKTTGREPLPLELEIDSAGLHELTASERSTMAAARHELQALESSTRSITECVRAIARPNYFSAEESRLDSKQKLGFPAHVIDVDRLRGALFAATSVFIGFVIWVYVNPPGHAAWFMLPGSLGLAVAGTQQMKTTVFVKPLFVALPVSIAAYVLVLPKLSSFVGLGLLIFTAMFSIRYFFTGLAGLCGTIALLQGLVTNQQSYDFASVANSALFTIMCFAFVFAMSYMVRSARPEKAVLALVRRFFRSAEKLLTRMQPAEVGSTSWLHRYRRAHWMHEVRTIPSKVEVWGRAIDSTLYPGTKPEQVTALVTSLRVLVLQIEDLLASEAELETASLANETRRDEGAWQAAVIDAFAHLGDQPGARADHEITTRLESWLVGVEHRAAEAIVGLEDRLDGREAEGFYRLLGGFRRLSESIRAYARAASNVNWSEWREERFS